MASLSDLTTVTRRVGPWRVLKTLYFEVDKDDVFVWAAAMAYSWLLAIFPFLIFLLTLIPHIPDRQKHQVLKGIERFLHQLPTETAGMLQSYVDETVRVLTQTHGGLMSLGLLLTVWAASGGMSQTMYALDRCYDLQKRPRPFYKQRPLAVILTIVAATLMLLVLLLLPIGGLVIAWAWHTFHLPEGWRVLVNLLRWLMAVVLMMGALNVIYFFGTRVKQRYRFVTPGAAFCVLMWIVMGLGFRMYIDRFAIQGYNKTYGAMGGLVILLFVMYLVAVCLLLGAEINSLLDQEIRKVQPQASDLEEPPSSVPPRV
jgi:membrane protein